MFPFPDIQLYVVLALAATLASVVATHLRSLDRYSGRKSTSWLAIITCILLAAAWLHLIAALAWTAYEGWQAQQVIPWQLAFHLLIIAAMLPIVCVTVMQSWTSGVKNATQVQGGA